MPGNTKYSQGENIFLKNLKASLFLKTKSRYLSYKSTKQVVIDKVKMEIWFNI